MNRIVFSIVILVCTVVYSTSSAFAQACSNHALKFDGVDDFVEIPDNVALNFCSTCPMTVEGWVYREGSNPLQHILGKRPGCTASNYWQIYFTDSGFHFRGSGGMTSDPAGLPIGQWKHFAGVFDGTNYIFYVDGVFKGSSSGTLGVPTGQTLRLGTSGTCPATEQFNGQMDEIRIWNRALTQSEIQQNRNKHLQGNETGLIGYWDFEENGGNILLDKTANGFNGTLQGAPTWVNSGAGVSSIAPSITAQPISITKNVGDTATFKVIANGTQYKWYKLPDTTTVLATTATFAIPSVALRDSGNYRVKVINSCDSVWSNIVHLTLYLLDSDGDGVSDTIDNCPTIANSNQENSDIPKNLGAWLMNEGTGTTIKATDNSTIATLINTPQWVTGRNGLSALDFNGSNQYVNGNLPLNGKSNATISAWIKTSVVQGNTYIISVPKSSGGNNGFDINLLGSSIRSCSFTASGDGGCASSNQNYADNQWHHIAATYDGALVRLYWDGNQVSTFARTEPLVTDGNLIQIGRFGTFGGYYKGSIDEVFIADRTLTPAEITLLSTRGISDNLGDACDSDDDDDGTPDVSDSCPLDRNKIAPGLCGCGVLDTCTKLCNLAINLGSNRTVCQDSLTTLIPTITNAKLPIKFLWSNGDTTPTFTPKITGNYSVTVTDADTCSKVASVTITYLPVQGKIIPDVSNLTICKGNMQNLSVSSANSVLWSTNQTTTSITVTVSKDTVIRVSGLSSNGCAFKDTISLFASNELIGTVNNLVPLNGALGLNNTIPFSWSALNGAVGYDLYVWLASDAKPTTPSVSSINVVNFQYTIPNAVYGGTYNWQVVAKGQFCSSESAVQTFTLRELPDLLVSQVLTPLTANSGQTFQMSWNIKNMGLTDSNVPEWLDRVWLSSDTVLQTNQDRLLGTFSNFAYLLPNEQYANQGTFPIENGIEGNYYIIVATDATGLVVEQKENNNTRYAPLQIVLTPAPDLRVEQILAPDTAFSGTTIQLTFKVKNNGTGVTPVSDWADRIYFSKNPTVNFNFTIIPNTIFFNDKRLGVVPHTGILQKDSIYTVTKNVTLPPNINGLYYLHVYTDLFQDNSEYSYERGYVYEGAAEFNNSLSIPINIKLSPHADLEINTVTTPSVISVGESFPVQWIGANNGFDVTSANSWIDRVYISKSATYKPDSLISLGDYAVNVSLIAGLTYNATKNVIIPRKITGTYYTYIVTDVANNVFEGAFENNNFKRSNAFTIINPDLIPTIETYPLSISSGQKLNVQWRITNSGTGSLFGGWEDRAFISKLPTFNIDSAIYLGAVTTNTVVTSANFTVKNQAFTLPNGISGNYYLYVFTDYGNQILETGSSSSEGNNIVRSQNPVAIALTPPADLVIESLNAPTPIIAGSQVNLTWQVRNNGTGTTNVAAWNDKIYISTNPVFDASAILLGISGHGDSLKAGTIYTDNYYISIPINYVGNYYLHLKTDADDAVFELGAANNNNVFSLPISINAYPPVDLIVTNIASPTSANTGSSLSLQWTVKNQGTARTLTNAWKDRIYLSQDAQLTADDISLLTDVHSVALNAGEQYTANRPITLPLDKVGNYFIIVQTDAESNVNDINRTNNTRATTTLINIALTPPSDLRVTNLVVPTQGIAGQPLKVKWTITNASGGVTNSDSWFEGIYLSNDALFDVNDLHLGAFERKTVLNGGASYTDSLEVEIPNYIVGAKYIILRTDNTNKVFEFNAENNNTQNATVQIVQLPPADLVVNSISIPPTGVLGNPITINYTITNQSAVNSANGFLSNAIYFSKDSLFSSDDITFGDQRLNVNILPNGSFNATFMGIVQNVLPENYKVIVRTNIKNNIRETSIANNSKISNDSIKIQVQNLPLATLTPNTLTNGQLLYYKVTVQEGLDLRLTLTGVTGNTNEVFVSYGKIPTLSNFEFGENTAFQANQEILIPTTKAGDYYVLVYGRKVISASESINVLAEALPFSITRITPDHGGAGGKVTCTVFGAGFRDSMKIYLKLGTDTIVQGKILKLVNSTEVVCNFNLKNVSNGVYNVAIKKLNGVEIVKSNGFVVETATALQVETTEILPSSIRQGSNIEYEFKFKNISNIDIPFVKIEIYFPHYNNLKVKSSDKLITLSKNLLGNSSTINIDSIQDYWDDGEIKTIPVSLKYFQPNSTESLKIGITNFPNSSEVIDYIVKPYLFTEYYAEKKLFYSNFKVFANLNPSKFTTEFLETINKNNFIDSSTYDFFIKNFPDETIENNVLFPNQLVVLSKDYSVVLQTRASSLNSINAPNCTKVEEKCVRLTKTECEDILKLVCRPTTLACGFAAIIPGLGSAVAVPCALGTGTFCLITEFTYCRYLPETKCVPVLSPCDPNEIIGPPSYSDRNWVSQNATLPYTIRFENDSTLATAPAQVVNVVQKLDPHVDARSFRLGSFGFGQYIFEVPENQAFYSKRLNLIDSLGIYVDVIAGIDVQNNTAFWTLKTIDPATGLQPNSPLKGFLAVNNAKGDGQGFVSYTVRPAPMSVTGDSIYAQARIVFDINAPIETPQIFNTIDALPPQSQMTAIADTTDTGSTLLTWTGADDTGGCGIKSYSIYVSKDNAPFVPFIKDTLANSTVFRGEGGHAYRFFSIAKDNVDNEEALKTIAEAKTFVKDARALDSISITLTTPWNLVSSYVNPAAPNMLMVLKPIETNLAILKNGAGATTIPSFGINNVGDWKITEGYQIKVTQNTQLVIKGRKVKPSETPVPIAIGWQIIPYLKDQSENIVTALSPIQSNIVLVKNNIGQTYIPQFGINDIGQMLPGQGYLLKSGANTTLTYTNVNGLRGSVGAINSRSGLFLQHFIPNYEQTGNNATLIVKASILDTFMTFNDEIGVFTLDGKICGGAVFNGQNFAVTIWGDDATTPQLKEGLSLGEAFVIKVWKSTTNKEYSTQITLDKGNSIYGENAIFILDKIAFKVSTPTQEVEKNVYFEFFPNPAHDQIQFEIGLSTPSKVKIELWTPEGKLAAKVIEEKLLGGMQRFSFNSSDLSNGVYLIRFTSDNVVKTRRVVIVGK
jgi:Concanavalin A-like lectin/glucanases superfamily/CARDB/Secretion system C-terminal sorting domain/Thrombospondin type 3 repeat